MLLSVKVFLYFFSIFFYKILYFLGENYVTIIHSYAMYSGDTKGITQRQSVRYLKQMHCNLRTSKDIKVKKKIKL